MGIFSHKGKQPARPAQDYFTDYRDYYGHHVDGFLEFRHWHAKCKTLSDLLIAEYDLRSLTQREEMVQKKVAALRKAAALEENTEQLEAATKQLEEIQLQFPRKDHILHWAVSGLPLGWRRAYKDARSNAEWFMITGLIDDCSDQSGCCSRGCGCCAKRATSQRVNGRGHCTLECWCCANARGFELPNDEKAVIREEFEKRIKDEDCREYLCRLGNSFFSTRISPKCKPA